jgi:hypothetical protein
MRTSAFGLLACLLRVRLGPARPASRRPVSPPRADLGWPSPLVSQVPQPDLREIQEVEVGDLRNGMTVPAAGASGARCGAGCSVLRTCAYWSRHAVAVVVAVVVDDLLHFGVAVGPLLVVGCDVSGVLGGSGGGSGRPDA